MIPRRRRAARKGSAVRQVLALALAVPLVAGGVPSAYAAETAGSTGEYLVQAAPESLHELTEAIDDVGAEPAEVYDALATVAVELTAAQVAELEAQPGIEVSPDTPIELAETQNPPPSWGLDRIDGGIFGLDSAYDYDPLGGSGVRIYVVDTGISPHPDLGGRLEPGYSAVGDGRDTEDCNGHGTHVAGTAAGTEYGVAKAATVVPVRVFGCTGQATSSDLVDGLTWIAEHHPIGSAGVVNISATGPSNAVIDAAVEALVDQGLVVTVAAGNASGNACSYSPAAAPSALTVGAMTQDDAVADFSNRGPCLDLFAPGVDIPSLSIDGATQVRVASGTSMAAPHVAGAAALELAARPGLAARSVRPFSSAVVRDPVWGPTPQVSSSLATNDPAAPVLSGTTHATSLSLTWTPPPQWATRYDVAWREVGAEQWNHQVVTSPALELTDLRSDADYEATVTAGTYRGFGRVSAPLVLHTAEGAPTQPTLTLSTRVDRVTLSWTPPASADPVSGYVVHLADGDDWREAARLGPTTTTWELDPVPATSTRVRVRAETELAAGAWSYTTVTPVSAPAASGVSLVPQASGALVVKWRVPPLAYLLSGLAVETSTDGATWVNAAEVEPTVTAVTLEGLEAGTQLQVRVTSLVSGSATVSSDPAFAVIDGAGGGPTALRASAMVDTITAAWAAPSDEAVEGYVVELSTAGEPFQPAGAVTSPTIVIADLEPGSDHRLRVAARTGSESLGPWSELAVRTDSLPAAPLLTIQLVTSSMIRLSWARPTTGAESITWYPIERLVEGEWRQVLTYPGTTQAQLLGLSPGTTYTFRVAARSGTAQGPWSEVQATTTEPCPPSLSSIASLGRVLLTWSPSACPLGSPSGYLLERSVDGAATAGFALPATLRSAAVRDVSPGSVVTARLAVRSDDPYVGSISSAASPWTTVTVDVPEPPGAAVASVTAARDSATLTWIPPSDDDLVTGYRIELATEDGWLEVARTTAAGREATVDGLDPGITYRLRLTPLAGWVPGAPTELTATTQIRPIPADARALAQLTLSPDLTGDRTGDLVGVDLDGRLTVFTSTGRGAVGALAASAPGWAGLGVFAPGDWDGDTHNDLMARDALGRLWLYPGTGSASFDAPVQVGRGWTGYRVVPAGDLTGDRVADLLAIDSGGLLWLYPGAGGGAFRARVQVGRGWGAVELYAGGDQNRDGRRDILGIDGAGRLYFYAGRGDGAFARPLQVGKGWAGLTFASGADLTGDGVGDLVGRDADRRLWLYPGRTSGSFGARIQVGAGW